MSYWSFEQRVSEDDALHYGVIGMKWGVRRYQNYDGTRTRKGVERYKLAEEVRKKANQKYQDAKIAYKSGKTTKAEFNKARIESKKENKKTRILYRDLARAKRADEGAKLYQKGKTISGNNASTVIKTAASSIGAVAISNVLSNVGNERVSNISRAAVISGGSAINILLSIRNESQNKKLRAYYGYRPAKV